jgi:hypothetical protein
MSKKVLRYCPFKGDQNAESRPVLILVGTGFESELINVREVIE